MANTSQYFVCCKDITNLLTRNCSILVASVIGHILGTLRAKTYALNSTKSRQTSTDLQVTK